ncbi:hypothetical protein ACWD3I_38275 [Streptomyces sp. NPDC002817]|uniref:hypothetical protein n=1 Tax=Streptomyces sp. NPDC088357 TaxID=3154655 RepID=UPI00342E851B
MIIVQLRRLCIDPDSEVADWLRSIASDLGGRLAARLCRCMRLAAQFPVSWKGT